MYTCALQHHSVLSAALSLRLKHARGACNRRTRPSTTLRGYLWQDFLVTTYDERYLDWLRWCWNPLLRIFCIADFVKASRICPVTCQRAQDHSSAWSGTTNATAAKRTPPLVPSKGTWPSKGSGSPATAPEIFAEGFSILNFHGACSEAMQSFDEAKAS